MDPVIISALIGLAPALLGGGTKAPGAPDAQMDFAQDKDKTIAESFVRDADPQTPWMQAVSGNYQPSSPTGFGLGLQQLTNQGITMGDMFG